MRSPIKASYAKPSYQYLTGSLTARIGKCKATRHILLQAANSVDADKCALAYIRRWRDTDASLSTQTIYEYAVSAIGKRGWAGKPSTERSAKLVLQALARRAR